MTRAMLLRVFTMGVLTLLLLFPLAMVRHLVGERQARARSVVEDIAASSARAQQLGGPFLVLGCRVTEWRYVDEVVDKVSRKVWQEASTADRYLILQPETLAIQGQVAVDTLRRGIYETQRYTTQARIEGRFVLPPKSALERRADRPDRRIDYVWGDARVVVGVTDARGIAKIDGQLGAASLAFLPGSTVGWLKVGVHAPLGLVPGDRDQAFPFDMGLRLVGTGELHVTPVGKETRIALSGNWPHPSFVGQHLPATRSTDATGFRADWQTSYWATGLTDEALDKCGAAGAACEALNGSSLGVKLVDPVDRYLLTERTVKYAELFLLTIFGAFFLLEVMKRLSVHPVQYGLVGVALALFFLLTLSLSEHVSFAAAYWMAAGASIALIGYYVSHVLGGARRGLGFSGLLAVLYGLLFGILQSEDMALLMGSLALFGFLAVVMVLTRRVNWYTTLAPDPTSPRGS